MARWPIAPRFPVGALGYPMLRGVPLSPQYLTEFGLDDVAGAIACFMLALHRFPASEALACDVPGPRERWAS
jgi:hypothetical protein